MLRIAHNISRTIAFLGGALLALCAIVAAGVGSFLLVLGLCSVRAMAAPARSRRTRVHVARTPSRARAAAAEPAL